MAGITSKAPQRRKFIIAIGDKLELRLLDEAPWRKLGTSCLVYHREGAEIPQPRFAKN